jgi:hypothetical protein
MAELVDEDVGDQGCRPRRSNRVEDAAAARCREFVRISCELVGRERGDVAQRPFSNVRMYRSEPRP